MRRLSSWLAPWVLLLAPPALAQPTAPSSPASLPSAPAPPLPPAPTTSSSPEPPRPSLVPGLSPPAPLLSPYPSPYPAGAYPPPGAYPYPPPGAYPYPPGAPAFAPSIARPAASFRTETRTYGWQTLIADGTSLAVIFLAASSDSAGDTTENVALVGALGFVLATPIIHWSNGNTSNGWLSLGLRVGVPLLAGATIAVGVESDNDALSILGATSLVAWVPAAMILDAAVLARQQVRVPQTGALQPLVQPRPGGATLGLGGVF